jgi:hypothetical protein
MLKGSYCQKSGLTLLELLIALLITMLIVMGIWGIYIMALNTWSEGREQIAVQRQANIAMEKMIRGIEGSNGIREAYSADLPTLNSIEFTSGIDGVERSFYLDDTGLMYDPDTSVTGDETNIDENTVVLMFTASARVVTITLGVQKTFRDKAVVSNLETEVTLRN